MKQSQGSKTVSVIECINTRLQKYRVRWNFNDVEPSEMQKNSEMVSFTEEEILYKPTPADIEKVIAESGIDARTSELEEMASILGYEFDSFEKEMVAAKTNRIAADPIAQILEITRQNRLVQTEVTDEEALSYPNTFLTFEELCKKGKQVAQGVVFRYENKPWRIVQAHTPQLIFPPSKDTASLYVKIDITHNGTLEDPIPYEQMMLLEEGKYYSQYGEIYLCIKTITVGYAFDLSEMVSIVEKVETGQPEGGGGEAELGTLENPIPYVQMSTILEKGKYYIQYEVVYECIQATSTGMPYDLKDMVANVKVVEV